VYLVKVLSVKYAIALILAIGFMERLQPVVHVLLVAQISCEYMIPKKYLMLVALVTQYFDS
jgi:hypothetical protein